MNAVHHFATSARIEERLAKDDTLVFMIMDNMEDCIDQKDMYERTPLMSAISKGNGNIALLLLSRGADPKVADSSGKTPFVVACRDGNCTKFVDEVLCTQNEAYVNMGDSIDDMSALSWACLCGETDIVKRLLKAESVDLNRRANTSKGYTPLHLALLSESSEIMSIYYLMTTESIWTGAPLTVMGLPRQNLLPNAPTRNVCVSYCYTPRRRTRGC